MRLPDPERSRVVLIGTSRYEDENLPDLPAVGRGIEDLKAVLTDSIDGLVPEDHCDVLADEGDIRLIGSRLMRSAGQAQDLLLVYFAGHGLTAGRRHELYLALRNTEWEQPEFNALEYDKLRNAVLNSPATTKMIILDCCFSGRAFGDTMADPATELIGQVEVDGSYVLASAHRDKVALILPGEDYTAFTGRLLRLFREGVPGGPELLTIDNIYQQLRAAMKAEGLPQPRERGTDNANLLAVARNRAFAVTAASLPPELQQAIENPLPGIKVAAVQELGRLLRGKHAGMALAARLALEQLTDDDSRMVAAAATAALGAPSPVPRPELLLSDTAIDLGRLPQHSPSPERRVRISNAGGGDLNARAAASARWLKLRHVGDELMVAVDTSEAGEFQGTVTVDSDGGTATIRLHARVDPEHDTQEEADREAREEADAPTRSADARRARMASFQRGVREQVDRKTSRQRPAESVLREDSRELGRARLRKEDARLIAGQTDWTDNITLPGTLHMAFVRSPFAHAKIISVDVSAARQKPGVIAAYSGADFAGEQGSLPCLWPVTSDIVIPAHPPMATDKVRYIGEAVALVVARDRYTAADALELIDIEYEPLPPVLDIGTALDKNSPKAHSGGNKCYEWTFANGDLDAAFRGAPVILEREYYQPRLIPSAMEPCAVVCSRVGDEYTLWSATQIPHMLRMLLAIVTGIPENSIRVIAPDVGGGFGSKLAVTAEDVLALLVTRKLGQPVKWTQSRSEGNSATHHGRDQLQRIRIAAGRDGRIRGLAVDLLADMGAYLTLMTPGIPLLGAFSYNSIYKMDAYSFRCTGVFTTKTPTDAYRGGGRLEATYAIERIMDDLAAELGMDPLDLRARNWIRHEEFPYTTISGLTYDSGNYEAATARAKELFSYDNLRREQAGRAARRDPVRLGVGASTYTAMCGLGPSRILGALGYGAGGWEHAVVRMLPTGKVEVVTGSSAHGQGHETSWSQIVADKLGVPFEDIQVLHGDTQKVPRGMDTYWSRSLVIGGMAVVSACEKVIAKAKIIAAEMFEVPPGEVEFAQGVFSTHSGSADTKTIQEVALAAFAAHNLPDGVQMSLDSDADYDPDNFSFPHGTHLCAVEVDTETGQVKIRSYVAVDDVGVVVNPLIVEGQVQGGIAQGMAQALYEEAAYDADGNLLTTTLADYMVPSAADLPTFVTDRTQTPSTTNPLGVKGAGEIGTIASTPAVVNAVIDALRPLGVTDVRMPCTPDRVWQEITLASARPKTRLQHK